MKKVKTACPVSNLDVLEAFSDHLSVDIITAISNHCTNSDDLMQMLNITRKQFYTRSSRLLKIGIISRKDGEIILTSFGRLAYNAQFIHCILASGISDDEQNKIIDKLLDDAELKKLFCLIPT